MRRQEKEIKSVSEIERILENAELIRIAMCMDNKPYIIAMNFGYSNNTIYLHSALEGKKVEILKVNNLVSFQTDMDIKVIIDDNACKSGTYFRSVYGEGKAIFIEDLNERKLAMDIIMGKYSNKKEFKYDEMALNRTLMIKINIEYLTGKKSGY